MNFLSMVADPKCKVNPVSNSTTAAGFVAACEILRSLLVKMCPSSGAFHNSGVVRTFSINVAKDAF